MNFSKEIKIGAIMVAAVAALVIGVQYLKGNDVFSNSRAFYSLYDKVDGLNMSSSITMNGLKVGHIKQIELSKMHPGKVLVTLYVTDDFEFSRDSYAHIESIDLLGSKSIAIVLGVSAQMAQDGDTLLASQENGLMNEVNKQIAPLKIKAEGLLSSMDSLMMIADQLLREDMRPNLDRTFESVRATLASIEQTSSNLDGVLSQQNVKLAKIMTNLERITGNLSASNQDISKIIKNFALLSDSLVKADVAKVILEASETLTSASYIMGKIERGEGTLGLLINDTELYNRLNSASDNLDALLEDVRLNPSKYVRISLIERRDKSSELSGKDLEKIKEALQNDIGNGNQ